MTQSYIALIQAWEAFLAQHPRGSLEQFAHWLLQRRSASSKATSEQVSSTYREERQTEYGFSESNSRAPELFWRLSKILKVYTKPILEAEGLKSQDEFAILTHIHQVEECAKKEAVETHFIDSSTGIDMIKRLIKRGLLMDRVAPHDRRARLVQLSPEGERLLGRIYQRLAQLPEVLVDMTAEEQKRFIEQLQRLDDTHTYRLKEPPKP